MDNSRPSTPSANLVNVTTQSGVAPPVRGSRECINAWNNAVIKLNELVIKPETFDGTRPSPAIWWEDFSDAVLANGWSEIIALKYFGTSLTGQSDVEYCPEELKLPSRTVTGSSMKNIIALHDVGRSERRIQISIPVIDASTSRISANVLREVSRSERYSKSWPRLFLASSERLERR